MDNEAASNIPHMHLFMELKRKFPELRDADITECIQRFGLLRSRCEEELSRRMEEQQRGYYSPWNQNRASSRSSTASRTSPLSNSDTQLTVTPSCQNEHSPSPPPGLSSPQTPVSQQTNSSCFSDNDDESPGTGSAAMADPSSLYLKDARSVYTCAADSTPSTVSSHYQATGFHNAYPADGIDRSPEMTDMCEMMPSSAPVISPTADPFLYDNPNRRSSAETDSERRKRILQTGNIAAIQEQLTRKEKIREVLNRRIDEKGKLEEEVRQLSEELTSKEINQRLDVARCKQRIEYFQQENSKLQFICDEMEKEILESGEAPKSDHEKRTSSPLNSSSHNQPLPPFPDSPQHPPQTTMARASSTSSLSSGVGTPVTPVMPSRRAPSPPAQVPTVAAQGMDQNQPQSSQLAPLVANSEDGGWSCSKCTFINSPYLNECEICSYPHFPVGTPSSLSHHPHPGGPCYCHHRHNQYNLNPDNSAGELQDIHIQVRHQNLHSPNFFHKPLQQSGVLAQLKDFHRHNVARPL